MDLILGALIAMGWPATALWVIGLFIGLEMLLHGFALMAIANATHDLEKLPV